MLPLLWMRCTLKKTLCMTDTQVHKFCKGEIRFGLALLRYFLSLGGQDIWLRLINYLLLSFIGSIIGFANLGEVTMQLNALEQKKTDESDALKPATSMLVLFVKGLFSSLEFTYAQFPCSDLTGPQMYDPVWEAVATFLALEGRTFG